MKKKVLFLCTGNSCRSQMAEGLLRHMAGDRFEVFSAGTHPTTLHATAIEVMKEIGIDISRHVSKSVEDLTDETFDGVITVCDNARETCPVFPGPTQTLHWSFPDPARAQGDRDQVLIVFRRVRDLIRKTLRDALDNSTI